MGLNSRVIQTPIKNSQYLLKYTYWVRNESRNFRKTIRSPQKDKKSMIIITTLRMNFINVSSRMKK
jgi:hypothetical protein